MRVSFRPEFQQRQYGRVVSLPGSNRWAPTTVDKYRVKTDSGQTIWLAAKDITWEES